ncbi:hypothetical protein LTR56_025259 [Elasticomyces elasticus]|nr:hypothetical protein LTR56_025259 [Elasticomyces elasticus]
MLFDSNARCEHIGGVPVTIISALLHREYEGADELPIWKVTRATSAAPFYFEMVEHEVEGVMKSFKDGGIRENNPSGAAISEFHALYEGRAEEPGAAVEFVQNLLIKYTEGEKQHHQMREHAHGEHTWYKRLNVSAGLEGMPLDDWRSGEFNGQIVPGGASLSHMQEATGQYLERDFDQDVDSYAPPSVMLRQAAEKLVRQRRAREAMGGPRWEAFVGKYLHGYQERDGNIPMAGRKDSDK